MLNQVILPDALTTANKSFGGLGPTHPPLTLVSMMLFIHSLQFRKVCVAPMKLPCDGVDFLRNLLGGIQYDPR